MKALSIRQPWADLIIQGEKTIELRSWKVNYHGSLAIHASQTIDKDACKLHGIDPDSVTSGAIIGTVDLVRILDLDEKNFKSFSEAHLANSEVEFKNPLYGWLLENPTPLTTPIPFPGRMGLFNIPDGLISQEADAISDAEENNKVVPVKQAGISSPIDWDSRYTFELRVLPEASSQPGQTPYKLALFQRYVEPPTAQQKLDSHSPIQFNPVATLGGNLLKGVADQVLETLRQNGYQATDLSAKRREPFALTEETGVRLALLFLAVKPITKLNRVEIISMGIRSMTNEELFYWFSKCSIGPTAERALKALRILLSEE